MPGDHDPSEAVRQQVERIRERVHRQKDLAASARSLIAYAQHRIDQSRQLLDADKASPPEPEKPTFPGSKELPPE